jgi:hypothetical protein
MDFLKSALENLHKVPLWLFLGLTCFGLITLYGPVLPGLNLVSARNSPWIGPATLLFGVLSAAKIISLIIESFRFYFRGEPKSAVISVNERINTTFWSSSRQPDGTDSAHINLNIKIHNASDRYLQFTGAVLTKPRLWSCKACSDSTLLVRNPTTREYSQDEFIHPQDTVDCTLTSIILGKALKSKRRLKVTFRIQDNRGSVYKVRANLFFAG